MPTANLEKNKISVQTCCSCGWRVLGIPMMSTASLENYKISVQMYSSCVWSVLGIPMLPTASLEKNTHNVALVPEYQNFAKEGKNSWYMCNTMFFPTCWIVFCSTSIAVGSKMVRVAGFASADTPGSVCGLSSFCQWQTPSRSWVRRRSFPTCPIQVVFSFRGQSWDGPDGIHGTLKRCETEVSCLCCFFLLQRAIQACSGAHHWTSSMVFLLHASLHPDSSCH